MWQQGQAGACTSQTAVHPLQITSGKFPANAAWLTLAAMTHNLLRAAGALASASFARARGATLRRDLIGVAARIARHGRGHTIMHLPERGTATRNG